MLEELGDSKSFIDITLHPALLLSKLSKWEAQDLVPASLLDSLWCTFVDQGLELLNTTLKTPLPERVEEELKNFRHSKHFILLLKDAADASGSLSNIDGQIMQLLCRLLRGLIIGLAEDVLQDLWDRLLVSVCFVGTNCGASPELLARCRNLDMASAKRCLQMGLVRVEKDLAIAGASGLRSVVEQLALQVFTCTLQSMLQELVVHPQAATALEYLLELLDEVETFSDLLDILRDPKKWMRLATAGGDMGIHLIVMGQKQFLEQAVGRSLNEEQVTLLCKSCGTFFAQGVAKGGLPWMMETLKNPEPLALHLLDLELDQLMVLEPIWDFAQKKCLANFPWARDLLQAPLENLGLQELLMGVQEVRNLRPPGQALTDLGLVLVKGALLQAFPQLKPKLKPVLHCVTLQSIQGLRIQPMTFTSLQERLEELAEGLVSDFGEVIVDLAMRNVPVGARVARVWQVFKCCFRLIGLRWM